MTERRTPSVSSMGESHEDVSNSFLERGLEQLIQVKIKEALQNIVINPLTRMMSFTPRKKTNHHQKESVKLPEEERAQEENNIPQISY